MTDMTKKPRYRVKAGGTLSQEQAIDMRGKLFYQQLLRQDTDEILKKAGISRHALKTLLTDPDIDQAVDRRNDELTSSLYTLMPSEGNVAEFVYSQLDLHRDAISRATIDSMLFGYDVAEMLWGKDDKGRNVVTSLTSKPMQWFEPKATGELFWHPNDGSPPVKISAQDDFQYRYLYQQHKATYSEPKGKSLLSRVYWLWYFKTNGWRFWSKFLERFGSPLLIGKTDAQDDDDAQGFADALLAAHNAGVVTVGIDEDVTAVSASNNGEAFVAYNNVAKQGITTYLLGQTLTSGTEGAGSYALAKIHQQQQEIVFSSDRKHAIKAIQHFVDIICYANGFDAPEFKWVSKKVIPIEQLDADKKAYEMGLRFKKSYFIDELGYEERHVSHVENGVAQSFGMSAKASSYLPTASNHAPVMAVTDRQFTPEQQELEDIGDYSLSVGSAPIDPAAILAAVADATDEDDLAAKLFQMVGNNIVGSEFAQLVETVIKAADLHGVVDEFAEADEA